jgi:hypothetical protein
MEMLYEAGFFNGPPPVSIHDSGLPKIAVRDLSWEGHDFVSALRNEGVWNKIKKSFSPDELASLPFDALKGIGIALVTAWAKQKVGI